MLASPQAVAHEWDPAQETVITGSPARRVIVDAGPGTGKTAVACARIAHLINEGDLTPTRVWMISFTRTAVAEIRNRLFSYVGEAAPGIKVATVDSQAWAIHSGYDEQARLTGSFESNIERVLELVTDDEDVGEYLEGIEHLVVDEAQDLVGVRADLVEAIIARLSPECGVTVFADEAQAIYDWADDDADESEGEGGVSLLERLRAEALRFEAAELTEIHRTSSATLKTIFSDVRKVVLSPEDTAAGLFEEVRGRIEKLADGNDLSASKLGFGELSAGTLILFRQRAEALMASQFCDVPHGLRLSGLPKSLPPWISACFGNWFEQHVSPSAFIALWDERVRPFAGDTVSPDDAWASLVRLAGDAGGAVDLRRLRNVLGRSNPPLEVVDPDFGLPGPILGTIHASKGREADNVLLLMPGSKEFEDEASEQEETRVLFVGSTRARTSLKVGKAIAHAGKALDSGRACRFKTNKGKISAMVEIGREEDVNVLGLTGRQSISAADAAKAQEWLLQQAASLSTLELVRVPEEDWNYRLVAADTGQALGMLPAWFKYDLWEVAKRAGGISGKSHKPPGRIRYLKALGSRSIALTTDDPRLEQIHAPWARSGFLLAPRLASFGYVWL